MRFWQKLEAKVECRAASGTLRGAGDELVGGVLRDLVVPAEPTLYSPKPKGRT